MYRTLLAILSTIAAQVARLTDIKSLLMALDARIAGNQTDTVARLEIIEAQSVANSKQIIVALTALADLQVKANALASVISQITIEVGPLNNNDASIQRAVDQANVSLAAIIAALAPLNQHHFVILVDGQVQFGFNTVNDLGQETLTIQEVDPAGQPMGPLQPSTRVVWAIASDPNSTPSVTLTPQPDGQTCIMHQTGQLASEIVISATAQLPGAPGPEVEQALFRITAGAGKTFHIRQGPERPNV